MILDIPHARRFFPIALLLTLATGLGISVFAPDAQADSSECFGVCPAPDGVYQLAGSSSYERAEERRARERAREARRARKESQKLHRNKVRGLEKQLKRAEKKTQKPSYGRKKKHGSNDGQAGSHCMYGTDGRLIYSPRGSSCAAREGGLVSPAASGASSAPGMRVKQGCVQGNCRRGHGVYVWADGSRYTGNFRKGLQHGNGSLVFMNGASYVGSWSAGKKSGTGTAIMPDGRVQTGQWSADRFLGAGEGTAHAATAGAPESTAPIEVDWPSFSKLAREVGGGRHDAAVVIGIQDYAHVAPIAGAERNAVDWYRYLLKARGIPAERVTLLVDKDATREEMEIAAEEAARMVGKKGNLWFVFIGHGAPAKSGKDGLLVGYDAQQKARSLSARSLERSRVIEILESSKARRIHLLLDACFSGKASTGAQLVAGLQPLVVTSSAPTSDKRMILLTAAASDEYAGPLPGLARPAFSYLVLGGLRGWADSDEDGNVEAGELHGYVSNAMRAVIRGRRQTPTFVGDEDAKIGRSGKEKGPDLSDMVIQMSTPARRR